MRLFACEMAQMDFLNVVVVFYFQMFSVLDNRRESNTIRQNLLESLLRECQQPTQPLLSELLQYYFQTESSSALTLIKQFNDTGREQSKVSSIVV